MPDSKQVRRKVSEFMVPEKPVKMRGAELAKAKFLKKMDKAYFSIMNLRDIREETEDLEASMPSEIKPSIIGEEVACQPAARREGGSGTNRGGEDKYGEIVGEEVACQPAARREGSRYK